MFESILKFFKRIGKTESREESSNTAKERLHLVLMQDRANVSADFLDMMKQEIIEVIKKYIDVDENAIDVRLTNKTNEDGTNGAPALYANIPIISIKEKEIKKEEQEIKNLQPKEETKKQEEVEKIIQPEKEEKLVEPKEAEQDKKQSKTEEKDSQQQTKQTETPLPQTEEKQKKQTKKKSTKAKI